MAITIEDIRNAINIPEETELQDDVILSAIDRSDLYTGVLQSRYSAPTAMFTALNLHYSIYLAYLSYSDRILNVQPGAYEEGKWQPMTEEIIRNTEGKLASLKQFVDDLVAIIKSYPIRPVGTFQHGTAPTQVFSIGMMNYTTEDDYSSY